MLDIQVEDGGDYTVCRPVGELDAYTVGQFREALGELASSPRLLIAANHYFIEFFAMLLVFRLYGMPGALSAAVQFLVVSVWVYAAFQKVYHRQFVSGLFFYVMFQDGSPSNRWSGMAPWVRPLVGPSGPLDRAGMIAALVPYRAKVVRIRRAEDLERFIADLQG